MSVSAPLPAEARPLLVSLALSPDPVFAVDRHNRIVFWNRSAERVLGYTEHETVGRSCDAVLLGCDPSGNRYCWKDCPVIQIASRNEIVRRFDLSVLAKDGHTVPVEVTTLTLAIPPPERFLVLHILGVAGRVDVPVHAPDPEPAPPRPLRVVASESTDARARSLTPREVEVLAMLAAGHPTAQIASRLSISNLTARNHIQNVLDKLEVHSKAEAVAFAFQKRLL